MNIRPANSINFNANYFLPGTMGGDHTLKFGGYYRDNFSDVAQHDRRPRDRALPDRADQRLPAISMANPNTPTAWCQVAADARRP